MLGALVPTTTAGKFFAFSSVSAGIGAYLCANHVDCKSLVQSAQSLFFKVVEEPAAKAAQNHPPVKALSGLAGGEIECQEALAAYSKTTTIARIARAVGGVEAFCKLPVLPWQDRFHEGKTGYIDGVQPSDLSSQMMRGVDAADRPYLSLRSETTSQGSKAVGAETLFQRYSNSLEPWTSGHHYDRHSIVSSTVDKRALEDLEKLAQGKAIEMMSYSEGDRPMKTLV